jgi:hypothetical protein
MSAGKPGKFNPTDDVKRRIVIELASFKTPAEVRAILQAEYDLTMDRGVIQKYDASKEYCAAGKPLQTLFHETRKEYVETVTNIPVAKPAYRLRKLQAMSDAAERQGNLKLAAELLEQAAKEVGGLYTNVRQIDGRVQHQHLTPDQARRTIEDYLSGKRGEADGSATKH